MLLLRYRALEKPSPALRQRANPDDEDDDEDDGTHDGVGMVNASKGGGIRAGGGLGTGRAKAGAARRGEESDGSDFDM
jgi:hypothetical protein